MPAEGAAIIRPRTTGELLDDAWRLTFADAPVLLLLTGVFLAPAFGALLLLTGMPAPTNAALRVLPPLLPLPLLVLTGLGSGTCQEWLRTRAEGKAPSFTGSITAAARRGLAHTAARAVALTGVLLGLGVWASGVALAEAPGGSANVTQLVWRVLLAVVAFLPAVILWPLLATIHAFFASAKARSAGDLGEYIRLARYDAVKVGVVTLSRLALLVLVFVNLHLLIDAALSVLDSVAGFDAAFVALQLTVTNPVYDLALALLSWMVLAPFFEASNFLLHVDARTRREGLDLQVRVQNVFGVVERGRVGALAVLCGLLLFGAAPARAADARYDAVHAARTTVGRIATEAKAAEPYDGGRWEPELRQMASRLEQSGGGQSFAWLRRAIQGFAGRNKEDALRVLDDLDQRLGLLEEGLSPDKGGGPSAARDELKGKLQQPGGDRPAVDARPDDEQEKPKEEKKPDEDKKDKQDDEDGNGRPRTALMGPPAVPGCGGVGLMLLAGLALAVVGVGAFLFLASRNKGPRAAAPPLVPSKTVQQTTERQGPQPHERPAAELWREADEQARNEQYLQAVRTLYHAVLSLLHRQQLLRFEATRTNGEYVQQVRLAQNAPPALHTVFQEFTSLFERKWYGDRTCDGPEFRAARGLAEEIQTLVREM